MTVQALLEYFFSGLSGFLVLAVLLTLGGVLRSRGGGE